MKKLAAAFLLVLLSLVSIGLVGQGEKRIATYVTAPVEQGSIMTLVKATGVVNPVVMVEVGSQLSGRVAEVLVNFNESVKVGQVIARIDPEIYIAAVTEATAVLSVAKASAQQQAAALRRSRLAADNARTAQRVGVAQLAAMRAQQEGIEKDFGRNVVLSKTAAISEREYTQSKVLRDSGAANLEAAEQQLQMKRELIEIADAEVAMAEASLSSAQAVVQQKQAALDQAELNLQRTEIRAPIDGIVIKRAINPGQTVAVSLESKTLFKIANDLSEMEVHGKIDEADVGLVRAGEAVTFTVDAYPNKVFSGRVIQVRKSPDVNQNVVTYTAVVSASNPDQALFPGMTARLRIVVQETEDSLKVPTSALHFQPTADARDSEKHDASDQTATVWVMRDDGRVVPVKVTTGISDDSATQVHSAKLSASDRVVTSRSPAAPGPNHFRLW